MRTWAGSRSTAARPLSVVDVRHAERLGLAPVGSGRAPPPGRARATLHRATLHRATLQVGRLRIEDALIASLDLSVLDLWRDGTPPPAGILG